MLDALSRWHELDTALSGCRCHEATSTRTWHLDAVLSAFRRWESSSSWRRSLAAAAAIARAYASVYASAASPAAWAAASAARHGASAARQSTPPEPPEAELRRLCNLATKEEMGDLEFAARRELPAFRDFPFMTEWEGAKPEIPADFLVAIIGSGFSGIAMAVQCEQLGLPYVVLERRAEAGGTWSVNRYPDVRVDTISITYEFNFEKEYRWSEYFGRGKEVREYLELVARKFGVHANTRFEHDLKRATFDEARDKWVLEVDTPDGIVTIEANAIVNGVGTFANPRFPRFEGSESFAGEIVHPARWPDGWSAAGRRVGIVGNGVGVHQ